MGTEGVNPIWNNNHFRNNKNSFDIFSWAVAVGSKGSLMVPGAMWAVAVSMWAITCAVWAATASMWTVTDAMWDGVVAVWAVTASMWAVTIKKYENINLIQQEIIPVFILMLPNRQKEE